MGFLGTRDGRMVVVSYIAELFVFLLTLNTAPRLASLKEIVCTYRYRHVDWSSGGVRGVYDRIKFACTVVYIFCRCPSTILSYVWATISFTFDTARKQ